jgi:hypothetical protein
MRNELEKMLLELGISEDFLAKKEAEFDNEEHFEVYIKSMINQLKRR